MPVFDRKCVEGQIGDPDFSACTDDGTNGFPPDTMAFDPGKVPLFRPPAVSIHNDGDVAGEVFRVFDSLDFFVDVCLHSTCQRVGDTPQIIRPASLPGLDLHDLCLFGGYHLINLYHIPIRELLHVILSGVHLIFGDIMAFLEFF